MVSIYEKIPNREVPQFSMPLSLRLIKESSQNNIDWKCLHIADLFSIIYSIRIDNAKQYFQRQRQEEMTRRGINSINKATESDFDNL